MTHLFYRRNLFLCELLIEIKELSIIFIINKNLSNENEAKIVNCIEMSLRLARCQGSITLYYKNELICEKELLREFKNCVMI